MSVMGFQKKFGWGGWVLWALSKFILDFLNFLNLSCCPNLRLICDNLKSRLTCLNARHFGQFGITQQRQCILSCLQQRMDGEEVGQMFHCILWYSRTPDERPPSPTTIPLIRPHFVWRTVVSVRIRIPHERPSLLYDHTNVILKVVV